MPEDSASYSEGAKPVKSGAWTEFADTNGWTKPADPINESLRRLRSDDPSYLDRFLREPNTVPDNHQPGEPLPIDIELKALFAQGAIGREPQSMVTVEEFLSAAPEIWGLNPGQVAHLRDHTLPEIEAWVQVWDEKEKESRHEEIERQNRFILQTWAQPRFHTLLTDVLPHVTSQDIHTALQAFQRFHGNDLERAFDAAEDAQGIDDAEQRRQAMQKSVDIILGLAARITRLHPTELNKIAENERFHGYLFLDSLAEQYPLFESSYDEAHKMEENLNATGAHVSQGAEFELLRRREEAIESLRYGAKDARSVQSFESYLQDEGRRAPNTKEAARDPDTQEE